MLGDINISEPGALMDSAGPRVVETQQVKIYQKVSRLLNFFWAWFLRLSRHEKVKDKINLYIDLIQNNDR
jgi:hypothetical protein